MFLLSFPSIQGIKGSKNIRCNGMRSLGPANMMGRWSWVHWTVKLVLSLVSYTLFYHYNWCFVVIFVLPQTFCLDFSLHTARVANAPQHEEGEGEESRPQQVSEGRQVGYWIAVRVFTPPPKSVDHTVGYTQQGGDLEGRHAVITSD